MTRTSLISCDVCKELIEQNPTLLQFTDEQETVNYDVCQKCLTTKRLSEIMNTLLSFRNPPFCFWVISLQGSSWSFDKTEMKP